MNKKHDHINLKFNCQEDPESMVSTSNGEFCVACQKEVIDFTSMTFEEIKKIRESQSEMCGKFRPDQVDPSLRPIEVPKVRSIAFLSTLLLSLNLSSASAQSIVDPKVEQSQGASNAPNLIPEEAKKKSENGQHISMSKASVQDSLAPLAPAISKRKRRSTHYKKLFWSWRFPFVHKKRNYRGKF